MKDNFRITVIFNQELIDKTKAKTKKNIYSKNSDEKKNELKARLEKKAAEDNVKFQKRKLSRLFNPAFNGYIVFSGEIKLDEGALIDFADLFFEKLEKDFAVNILNYNLKDIKNKAKAEDYISNFFEFEVFNYNFNEHKAIKSEFIKLQNIRKIIGIAEPILDELANKFIKESEKSAEKTKKKKKTAKKTESKTESKKTISVKPPAVKAVQENKNEPPLEEFKQDDASVICETVVKSNIGEQINAISLNWSLLSPAENIPVLEAGEPAEIFQESIVRMYFQKPNVRQVIWRFRKKAGIENSQPILRVYEGGDMLWYETLEGLSGSRYIIFPEDLELPSTWVEIGYLTDKGGFIFIARSPAWPPHCLFKKLPKLNLERKIPGGIRLIGIGAMENISGGNSGAGFSGSGAGIK